MAGVEEGTALVIVYGWICELGLSEADYAWRCTAVLAGLHGRRLLYFRWLA